MPINRDRRHLLQGLAALSATGLATSALAEGACAVFTRESQAQTTPAAALQRLREGNARFVAGKGVHCDLMQQVRQTAGGQAPFAAVVGCIDSRVPPELVFDQRVGDIFAARVAGNIDNDDILGSLEFATQLAGARAIVVLGHTECGAVKGAVDDARLGHLTGLLAQIRPALTALKYEGVPSSKDAALVQRVAERNVQDAMARLMGSEVLAARVGAGELKIAGAMHDVATGEIRWLA